MRLKDIKPTDIKKKKKRRCWSRPCWKTMWFHAAVSSLGFCLDHYRHSDALMRKSILSQICHRKALPILCIDSANLMIYTRIIIIFPYLKTQGEERYSSFHFYSSEHQSGCRLHPCQNRRVYVWNGRNGQEASMLTNEFVFCKHRCGGKEVSLSKN